MEEVNGSDGAPDLKELEVLEVKVGRKTPAGLLRWMRQDAAQQRGEQNQPNRPEVGDPAQHSLDEKIRKLRMEMAHLRSVDVRILQQLLALHEGIEAAKWLLEDRGTLTSHCSSLTGSQYSLGGSWSSLHEPQDKLDNMSIGSYLDTLADDLDEYTSSGAESILSSKARPGGPKEDAKPSPAVEATGSPLKQGAKADAAKVQLGRNPSPKGKTYKNGKVEPESCKMSGKVHMEHEAHWHWVQSQDDVTFL
ncbi:leucine rich adaptor protein 1 [Trichomycterus rosablanca]|uniref:leucine rich adaptor protein 1 n=1 Tax=Trichomycterus rosablanca TaxID=2290929 RepID=UPI002F360210